MEGLTAFIGGSSFKKEVALSKLVDFPRFLRFDRFELDYKTGYQSIVQKCGSFRGYLSSIKATLYDSNVIQFDCEISKDQNQFSDHSTLLEHIRHIVSICDSSREYSFRFYPCTDHVVFGNVMSSILEMTAIVRSSYVFIKWLYPKGHANANTQLPVETISNWLHQESHVMKQKQRHRRLSVMLSRYDDLKQDFHLKEMCDFLKQVSFYFQTFFLNLFVANFAKRLQNF